MMGISIVDEIHQKIIWMCHLYFTRANLILPRSLGLDPDTPSYMKELSGSNIYHVKHSKGKKEYYTAFILLGGINWNIEYAES